MVDLKFQSLHDIMKQMMMKISKVRKFLNLLSLHFKDQKLEKAYIKS